MTDKVADAGQVEQFRKLMKEEIAGFDGQAGFNTKNAFARTKWVILFSGLTTILVAIGQLRILEPYSEWISIPAIISSAVTSGFAAWESFFSYKARWIAFTEAASDGRRIQEQLEYLDAAQGKIGQAKLNELFEEFQDVRDNAHAGWARTGRGKKK